MAINTDSYRYKTWVISTIASGVITPAQELVTVAAESGTADDLDTINTSGFTQLTDAGVTYLPSIVIQADAGDTITVKHNTGNIALFGGVDIAITGNQALRLLWNGSRWVNVNPTSGGGGGGMTSFTVAGTSGTPQTITDGNTLTIAAGTGISTTASATDTVTVALTTPVSLANGGTGADLSATGGTGQVVKQSSAGGVLTVGALAESEIPSLAASKITSGVFAEARGGTNQSTYATGDLLYASGTNTLAKLAVGTAGQVLTVSGGVPVWAGVSATGGIKQVVKYEYEITATGYSTTSTTFVDVDATNLATSITTTGGNSTVLAWATFSGANANATSYFDLILGTTRANTSTSVNGIKTTTGQPLFVPVTITGRWTSLAAATHTIKLQFRTSSGTNAARVSIDSGNVFQITTFTIILVEI